MRKASRIMILAASFAAATPFAASAATHSLFTPSAQLVQKINNSYGTTFKAPMSHVNMAAQHQARLHRAS